MWYSNLENCVAKVRKTVGLSQKDFAARLGIGVERVRRLESGVDFPDLEMALSMADILGTDLTRLYTRKHKGRLAPKKVALDLTGRRFGKLVVIERMETQDKSRSAWWLCQCDCGEVVPARSDRLTMGDKCTCGKPGHKKQMSENENEYGRLRGRSIVEISKVLREHPNYTQDQVAEVSGFGLTTVQKRWVAARRAAGLIT